ncbi:hypothetical protein FJ976_25405 [Mesorhizobium sp. B1-1-9]|nr:hypothetical protein FJ976_25405 [Mesorhizobium sp. B1-1-9]TPN45749.1 hypothetical protein FJ978_26695 [Mesorhizobium sp. B1-1-7]
MRPFLILSLCNRSFAGPALARSKPRRDEWPERERAYRKKGFGSQSRSPRQGRELYDGDLMFRPKDKIGKNALIA